jgi:two-component system cell cycle response regulator
VKEELLVRVKNLIMTKYLFDQVEIQQEQLYKQAMEDHLTGLHNRHAMESLIPNFCGAAIRHKKPIGILFFDIDHFKRVNDNHGHVVGDNVLEKMGQTILSNFRSEDFSARYGGEEFIVILYDTTYEQTIAIAENFRHKVENIDFSGLDITISIGALACNINAQTEMNDLLAKADELLYEAKESGRNCVRAKNYMLSNTSDLSLV